MHRIHLGGFVFLFGLVIVFLTAILWFRDVIEEASFVGFHTLVVKRGLVYGFFLFILSEIMLFFGFFWAFFHSSLSPSVEFGNVWPVIGIDPIKTVAFPLFNTALLIISGFAVT
jgi:cytochrome c oxidase subunit 3